MSERRFSRQMQGRPLSVDFTSCSRAPAALKDTDPEERRRALRCLLMNPLLTASGQFAMELVLVRRHASWLRDWLARFPGWSLQIEPELARLYKTPADTGDATRPAYDSAHLPFTRRRYVYLCLALAALERADRQTTLGNLAKEIQSLASVDDALAQAGFNAVLSTHDQRRDIVEVVRLLLQLRVIVRIQGDEQQYLHERGDVLYTVCRPALSALLNAQRGPSTVETNDFAARLRALVEEPMPNTEEAKNRRLRTGLVRKLLDDPVVYFENLSEEERAYFSSQRHRLLTEIENATGLIPEVRREGIAMVDERGDLSDIGFPDEGTEGHLTLLLAEHLAERARNAAGKVVSRSALENLTSDLIARHRAHWRKDVSESGAEVNLTATALERLEALRLVQSTAEGVAPLPAIARYTLEVKVPEPPPSRPIAQKELDFSKKRR